MGQQHNVSKAVCKLRNGRPNNAPEKLEKLSGRTSMHVAAPKREVPNGLGDLKNTAGNQNLKQPEEPIGLAAISGMWGVKPESGRRRRTAAEILASRRLRTPPVLARLLEEIREANRRVNRKSANQA